MTLLLKLTTVGFFVGLLVVGQTWLPPFPAQFGDWLSAMFERILQLETWLPVRLMINLWAVTLGVDVAVYLWKFAVWFKAFLLGEPRT